MCHMGLKVKFFNRQVGQNFDVVMSGPFNKNSYLVKENSTWSKPAMARVRFKLIQALPYQIILNWPHVVSD